VAKGVWLRVEHGANYETGASAVPDPCCHRLRGFPAEQVSHGDLRYNLNLIQVIDL